MKKLLFSSLLIVSCSSYEISTQSNLMRNIAWQNNFDKGLDAKAYLYLFFEKYPKNAEIHVNLLGEYITTLSKDIRISIIDLVFNLYQLDKEKKLIGSIKNNEVEFRGGNRSRLYNLLKLYHVSAELEIVFDGINFKEKDSNGDITNSIGNAPIHYSTGFFY